MKFKCEKCGWENSPEKVYCDNCKEPLIKDVFISYSRKDYADSTGKPLEGSILVKLKSFLTELGLTYWFDEEGIFSGDDFAGVLTQAIRTSKVFLFVSSVNSNQSPWTSREIAVALMYKKVIIPFKIDDSPYNDAVAMKVAELDRIDYFINHGRAMDKLERALRHHLSIPPQATTSGNEPKPASRVDADIKEKPKTVRQQQPSISSGIQITISDRITPIAMLLGPPGVGKTMSMIRLSRYLFDIGDGYAALPGLPFRPDAHYARFCELFQPLVHNAVAIDNNEYPGPFLVNVTRRGMRLLQLIDVPGEVFPSDSGIYPPYFNDILCMPNRKCWVFFFELNWGTAKQREEYVKAIGALYSRFAKSDDDVIIVINKIDKLPYVNIWEVDGATTRILSKDLKNEYPWISDFSKYTRSLFRILRPDIVRENYTLVPFMTGLYDKSGIAPRSYSRSPETFPKELLKALL